MLTESSGGSLSVTWHVSYSRKSSALVFLTCKALKIESLLCTLISDIFAKIFFEPRILGAYIGSYYSI